MNSMRRTGDTMRRRLWAVLIGAGVLAAGCGGENERPAQKIEVAPGLRVQKIQLQSVADELEAPGTVIAVSTAQVAARTMGTVLQVVAREGDFVKRGQVLAQLDERELASRRSAAQAGAQGATAGVAQATKALAAAQANLEQVKAALRQAEAGSAQAESEAHAAESVASYTRVVAPFDGRVIRRTVEPGSLVSPGMLLFVVEDSSRYQLEATLPAEAVASVKKNAQAHVELDGLQQKSLSGKVAEIEAGADPASHTLKARIDLPKEAGVQSGMFGRAFFSRGEKRALLVPGTALADRGQLRGVYVVGEGGLLRWRVVTVGRNTADVFEVLSGLNDGDVVVSNPGTQELDGKKVAQ